MTYYVHVNRQVIASNKRHGKNDPPVRFQKGRSGKSTYCYEAELGPSRIVYDGEQLLKCGARLIIATEQEPKVIR